MADDGIVLLKSRKKCPHEKQKDYCKECGGSQICPHGKVKAWCKECGGSQICPHGREKAKCKECGGSGICPHGKQKATCKPCDFPIHPQNWCQLCQYVKLTVKKFKPYCFTCYCITFPNADIPRQYKLKEHHLQDALKTNHPNLELIFDKRIDNGCSRRRPDIRIELLTHSIVIECDEHQHKNYSCENKRTMEIFQDLGNRPIVFIRFNPDKYDSIPGCFTNNKLNRKEWNRRIKILSQTITQSTSTIPTKEVTTIHLFYSDSDSNPDSDSDSDSDSDIE